MRPTGLGHTALHTQGPPGHPRAQLSCQASQAQAPQPRQRCRPAGCKLLSPTTPLAPELKGRPQGTFPRSNVKVEKSACPKTLERPRGKLCDAPERPWRKLRDTVERPWRKLYDALERPWGNLCDAQLRDCGQG